MTEDFCASYEMGSADFCMKIWRGVILFLFLW